MTIRERLDEIYPETDFIYFDRLDDAIIGVNESNLTIIYSEKKIIELLKKEFNGNLDDALSWLDFNVKNVYLGVNTPIILSEIKIWN